MWVVYGEDIGRDELCVEKMCVCVEEDYQSKFKCLNSKFE